MRTRQEIQDHLEQLAAYAKDYSTFFVLRLILEVALDIREGQRDTSWEMRRTSLPSTTLYR